MMNEVWQVALAIIGSFGGAGVIIWACGRWLANLTAERMIKKTEFEFAKKLEDFKGQLENKNYISKVRFDLEMELYRELSAITFQMVVHNSDLFPYGLTYLPQDEEERYEYYKDVYRKAADTFNNASTVISQNASFIPEDVYEMFDDIRALCGIQLRMYRYCGALVQEKRSPHEPFNKAAAEQEAECYERTKEIDDAMKNLRAELRNHISSVDVVEKT